MHGFKARQGRFVARVDEGERAVVASVVADVLELLGAPRPDEEHAGDDRPAAPQEPGGLPHLRTDTPAPPGDPAVRRLLPDASRDDPSLAAEFRRLTEDDLRAQKVDRLEALWRALESPGGGRRRDELVVSAQDAPAVAAALTDLRLVLAERLGVHTDAEADAMYAVLGEPPPPASAARGDHETRRYLVSVYGALTWLQESLVVLMLADARQARRAHGDGPPGTQGTGDVAGSG
ncbi:hypothetical protein Cch01nite_35150 [Cellulomonas chitinilytica]|uniref:DUF2017 domain-containing protein n=2 Tax=Cellulomonas chitinilytica TaxID=398759 RepID=A0A919U2Y9_9CELL|nr:hypothetical protein Cch01nite_35150 [Cellulomonas chitinilytica]